MPRLIGKKENNVDLYDTREKNNSRMMMVYLFPN